MDEQHSLSRRAALAGLGAASLGLFMSVQAGAHAPNRETGSSGSAGELAASATSPSGAQAPLASHPLVGLWLTQLALPSHPDDVVTVPALFGADGSAVLIFPCTESGDAGVMLKGAAVGTWAPIDDRYAHFTAVHALSGIDGRYQGTATFDAYPRINDDNETFDVETQFDLFTTRDNLNEIVGSHPGPHRNPMRGYRMHPGKPGFPPALDDTEMDTLNSPEVAPVHPGAPRLVPTPLRAPAVKPDPRTPD